MNDPANPSALAPSSPGAGEGVPKSSGRVRLFTPIEATPNRLPKPPARLAAMAGRLDHDDLEALDGTTGGAAAPGAAAPLPPTSGSGRPVLVPNAAIPFLQEVHARSNPELFDRRISTATRTLAVAALVASAAWVIGSTIHFRAPSVTKESSTQPIITAQPALLPAPTAAETVAAVHEALAILETFLNAPTAELRREAIGTDEPLPPALASEATRSALARASVEPESARLLHAGSLKVVLVPLTDGAGLPRTAAVVHRSDRWRVDWRSLVTPETTAWPEVAGGTARGLSQFRVLLSRRPDGTWALSRPEAEVPHLTATTVPGSRVAAELEAALAARNGEPLSADVFLAADSPRSLNIVDWTPDKWSL
jgi:hypothetical protein